MRDNTQTNFIHSNNTQTHMKFIDRVEAARRLVHLKGYVSKQDFEASLEVSYNYVAQISKAMLARDSEIISTVLVYFGSNINSRERLEGFFTKDHYSKLDKESDENNKKIVASMS